MPRKAAGLTAAKVRTAKPGRYGDGNGLYLLARSAEARFWVFRYTLAGQKMREMGLGRAGTGHGEVPLSEARTKAGALHAQVREGRDPLMLREAAQKAAKAEAARALAQATTFREVAEAYMDGQEKALRNPKHRQQWRNTMATYAFPHMGAVPVGEVETAHVLAALQPMWTAKPETAGRVRGRIEAVLDAAAARGLRSGANPARWKGHLALVLPRRAKVAPVVHHAALPFAEAGAFVHALRQQPGMAARALECTILTAARSGEVLGARWGEIDLGAQLWTVPAARMKGGREHRVPLAGPAVALLGLVAGFRTTDTPAAFVFPGALPGRPLSIMAMAMVLRRMKRPDLTVHGFRSSFRDWCAERTSYPSEVAEAALAHAVGDKVEAAYRRGDLFEKRRHLMDSWATFCGQTPADEGANVVPLRA